jgi:hypothetical protein
MSEIRYTPNDEPTLGNVIRRQWKTQADFTYSILGNVISIIDLDLGKRSVTNDIENVLRKIEYYHQGSIVGFKIMYRDSESIWDGVDWDGQRASFSRCVKSKKDKRGRGF